MKIHDSLRQECMPEMVYSICKLAESKQYEKNELKRLITLGSSTKESIEQFNKIYRFSIESAFISESDDEMVQTQFTKQQLSDFRSFRYAVFMEVFQDNTAIFTGLCKWYLSQGTEIFTKKSAQDLGIEMPEYIFSGIDKEYVLGFRFWAVALGIAILQKAGSGATLVFATNQIIEDWLKFAKPFKKNTTILAKEFFNVLLSSCPVFTDCINGNDINCALSMGLRVLHQNNIINLGFTTDSGDIWHLTNSISNPKTNNITEIIVR